MSVDLRLKKRRNFKLVAGILCYLFTTAYISYVGRYETIYGAGFAAVLVVQVFGLIVFGFTFFRSKFKPRKSINWFVFTVSSIQLVLIMVHEIDQYQPTYVINIPENFQGKVYLLVTNEERADVSVNEHGIGYVGNKGKAKWEIRKGRQNISDAFETIQQNEILIRDSSNTTLTAYSVSCLDINSSNNYPSRPSDYQIIPCLDSTEFLKLVEREIIHEKILRKKVWTGNGEESSWVLDPKKSKL